MVLDHQAAANHLTVNDEESHLLKLPPEIRNRIFELALAHDYTVRIEPDWKEPRPSLLHVCRQIRAETRLVYQHLRKFYICANACNIDKVRRWVALITDEELRSIQDLTLQYQESVRDRSLDHVSHVEQRDEDLDAISEFDEIVSSLEQRSGVGNITKWPVRFRRPIAASRRRRHPGRRV